MTRTKRRKLETEVPNCSERGLLLKPRPRSGISTVVSFGKTSRNTSGGGNVYMVSKKQFFARVCVCVCVCNDNTSLKFNIDLQHNRAPAVQN
ncbi:hypothetical protein ANANG_G00244700 [Anguilla anguilla]|uniref:Uncharacterized protein n=1 Tax=Anguilla anguilla TaxID=7936 RepID=A0A9D3LQZ8_ANGAN|nr:hypothetical protein ANANG_G00244700 [Anguilla anguilla]